MLLPLPHLSMEAASPSPAKAPLAEFLPTEGLMELSGAQATGRTSTAVSLMAHTQSCGEVVAWIEPENGSLYPPDVAEAGVDLASLVIVHVPWTELLRAAELLLRSGAFGLVVVDALDAPAPARAPKLAWQSRLQALVRKHASRLVVLTGTQEDAPSLGAPVHLRVVPKRSLSKTGGFTLDHELRKNKTSRTDLPEPETWAAPLGAS